MSWLSCLPKDLSDLLQLYSGTYKLTMEIDDIHSCGSTSNCCLRLGIVNVIFEKSPAQIYTFKDVYIRYSRLLDFFDYYIYERKNYIDPRPDQYLDYPIKDNALDFHEWALVYNDNLFELLIFDYNHNPFVVLCENKKIVERIKFDKEFSNEILHQLCKIKKLLEYSQMFREPPDYDDLEEGEIIG